MRIDLNLNPVVGGKVRVMCKSYRQATKKKAKLERAYPDSCYLIGQDIGAHDAYALGAKVSHKEKHWTSTVANNVWEPGVYGWEEATDGV